MKDQPEDKFEQRIRARLQSLESDPPAGAWDRLAGDLPAASPVGYRRWAALLLLLAMMVGGAIWWTLTDEATVQKNAATNPAATDSRTNRPLASDAKLLPGSNKPPGLTQSTEAPDNRSSASPSELTKSGEQDNPNHDIAPPPRQNSAANPLEDADLRTESSSSPSSPATAPAHLSSGLATSASAINPEESAQQVAKKGDGRTPIFSVASNQLTMVTELPKMAVVFPSDNLISESLPSVQPTLTAGRWELWASANPMLLYQRVAPDGSDEIQVTSLNRATFSQDRLGMQVSAGGLYRLNPRLTLKFGVYYRYTRDQWTYDYHNNVTDSFDIVRIDENTVEATPVYEEQQGTISETSHRVGALAGVEYRLSNRWFSNVLGAELQAQSLAGEPDWYAHLSYVAARKLSDRWVVYGGPSFLWNFSGPGIRSDHFVLKPYGFGAQLGISYRLQLRR